MKVRAIVVQLQSLVTLAVDGDECSASNPSRVHPDKRSVDHLIEMWVGQEGL